MSGEPLDPRELGSEGPPIAEKPYKIVFDANGCIGTGRCVEVSDNWEVRIRTGMARPRSYFIDESELDANLKAAEQCPANKGRGVIHIIDRATGEELAPDPHGDGTISLEW